MTTAQQVASLRMVYIIHIPLFYQSPHYPFPTSPNLPTTTATCIAIPCKSPDAQAIFTDCKAWGWNVVHRRLDSPERDAWWKDYIKKARNKGWDDDLWRIWQREHGVRILQKDEEAKGDREKSMKGVQRAVSGVKKAGRWVKRNTMASQSTEWELRGLEEANRRAREVGRRQETGTKELRVQASTMSLPGSLIERLVGLEIQTRVS